MEWEKAVKEIRLLNWVILLVLGTVSYFLASPAFTLGVLLGGLIIIFNFNLLQNSVRRAFSTHEGTGLKKNAIILKYYFRLAIVGLIIYILITRVEVNPIGLAIGLSTVVISIINFGLRTYFRSSSKGIV